MDLGVKIFADGADLDAIRRLARDDRISGLTTNPTLMRKAAVRDYGEFARTVAEFAHPKPVSVEVFGDTYEDMYDQARLIASWGDNIYVKVPVASTHGNPSDTVIRVLSGEGIALNVTAVFTVTQVVNVARALQEGSGPAIISVFAGRIADTGRDPRVHMQNCLQSLRLNCPRAELLWASPRQLYDLILAEEVGCDIITMTPDLLAKLDLLGRDLGEYSIDTVRMFYNDARASGYTI